MERLWRLLPASPWDVPEMAINNDQIIGRLLYGTPYGGRFLQGSPVMPELWAAFARNPPAKQDVLITPQRHVRSGEAARQLREAIIQAAAGETGRSEEVYDPSDLSLAPLASHVAARLSFPVLMRAVIPLTTWWRSIARSDRGEESEFNRERLHRQLEMALMGRQEEALSPGLIWLARSAGAIQVSEREYNFRTEEILSALVPERWDRRAQELARHPATIVSDAFLDLMPESAFSSNRELGVDLPFFTALGCIHRIVRNRSVELAVNKSASAIKADAARRLFDISCSNITWAVIDSGIDIQHDAFKDHIRGGCRVDAVYDFTILRELNDLHSVEAALANLSDDPLMRELARRQVKERGNPEVLRILRAHRDRLQAGDDVDYNLIEPLLRDRNPGPPFLAHGTHVAGILGADWRDVDGTKMTGVCPDIRLIDMRVVRPDGRCGEFEVISALEFLRHHNERSGRLAIHGANLSLSIQHNLRGGDACGRTPVCVECERAVNAGVCIVTAAGNRGTARMQSIFDFEWHGMEIYLDSSITDPGNTDAVITVGATHRNRPHEYGVSFFSSRGPTGDGRKKPDLVAPGEKIVGPAPGQNMYEADGTSMAAPHVSGAAALIMARHAELIGRPGQIKKILCETATDLKREAYFQGAGMVDVLRALQSI